MDEQVVPSFVSVAPAPAAALVPTGAGMRRSSTVQNDLKGLIPRVPAPLRACEAPAILSPAPEFVGKPRWETPLRANRQREPWQGARELGLHVCVRSATAAGVGAVIRAFVADVVTAHVGPVLPRATVEKWLCLLCEYLELNADEQVLVVCLLRRYVNRGGRFVGRGDWARPQRWECVVAVACYLAVLLTEEFPGRTAMDLRELLGPNFRFGTEQVTFLKIVDWRISVDSESFTEVKEACEKVLTGDLAVQDTIRGWFQVDHVVAERKKRDAEEAAATAAAMAAATLSTTPSPVLVGKKRGYTAIAPADDSVVPRVVVPRLEAHSVVPNAFVHAVPHWGPAHW